MRRDSLLDFPTPTDPYCLTHPHCIFVQSFLFTSLYKHFVGVRYFAHVRERRPIQEQRSHLFNAGADFRHFSSSPLALHSRVVVLQSAVNRAIPPSLNKAVVPSSTMKLLRSTFLVLACLCRAQSAVVSCSRPSILSQKETLPLSHVNQSPFSINL
jgi:hypothetical protein